MAILMMLALIPHSQIIKTSFNKTKAINDELNAINKMRKSHIAPNLFHDSGLCDRASDHADLIANTLVVQHCISYDFEYVGETIAYIQKPPNVGYFGGEATARWYSQETNYDYESGKSTNGENVDDFTTMVWRETTSVCIAIRETSQGSGRFYVVAHFFPVPNREGEYLNNVRKPI